LVDFVSGRKSFICAQRLDDSDSVMLFIVTATW